MTTFGSYGKSSRRQAAPGAGAHIHHRRRSRRGEGDKLRIDILDAAEELLAQAGSPDAVSMREIARRVGVSPPAIYLHFDDKDELFFECCNRRFSEMADKMGEACEGLESAMDRLEAMGRAYVEFGLSRGEQYQVMLLGKHPENLGVEETMELPGAKALTMAAAAVADGVSSGELRTDLDPIATAVSLWATTHGLVLVLLDKRKQEFPMIDDDQTVVDQALSIIRHGLIA
jgi:AcrR family transcriptional regulator